MKSLILLGFFAIAFPITAQKKTEAKKDEAKPVVKELSKKELADIRKRAEESQSDWKYVDKYVMTPKLKEMQKAAPRIEKKVNFYKDKVASASTPKAKKNYESLLAKEQANLEKIKLWDYYRQYYIKAKLAVEKKNDNEILDCLKKLQLIKKRYKAITAEEFPNPEKLFFHSPEGKKLKDFRRRKAEAAKSKSKATSSKK